MRMQKSITLLAFAAALAACSAETATESGDAAGNPAAEDAPAGVETTPDATGVSPDGPAGEVAAETREPMEEATTAAEEPTLPEGVDAKKWGLYYEHGIDFAFGSKAGLAKAAETGKPMMMFYTATW